jgi:8-oxo-dGTP diphosphatase
VNTYLEQLYTFGDPKRDPRERRIGVTYYALVPSDHLKLQAEGKAKDANWWGLKQLPELAFDHRQIVNLGYDRLKTKVGYSSIVLELMPSRFRLSELQKAYEVILGEEIDKRNFRKQIKELDLVEATGLKEMDGAHRPAMLFKAKKKKLVLFK